MSKTTITVGVTSFTNDAHEATGDWGAVVYDQLMAHKTLKFFDGGSYKIVPFHAVQYAVITRATETVEAPEDAFCATEE